VERARIPRAGPDSDRLAAEIGHELRNLLTVITLDAELLREESAPRASRAESVARICNATEQAISLTRRLLELGPPAARARSLVGPKALLASEERNGLGETPESALVRTMPDSPPKSGSSAPGGASNA